jgi:hypothetical protein
MQLKDCHDPFLLNLAMTGLKGVIAKLGNEGLKQPQDSFASMMPLK